jgi:hypothetical protein
VIYAREFTKRSRQRQTIVNHTCLRMEDFDEDALFAELMGQEDVLLVES